MPIETIFRVTQASTDGVTGHLSIHAQIVEKDGESVTLGVIEVHGIDPLVLESQFQGDGEKWRDSVRDKMMVAHTRRKKAYTQAHEWVGKEWPVEKT